MRIYKYLYCKMGNCTCVNRADLTKKEIQTSSPNENTYQKEILKDKNFLNTLCILQSHIRGYQFRKKFTSRAQPPNIHNEKRNSDTEMLRNTNPLQQLETQAPIVTKYIP